ncbi:MAG: extracellular solute-binding protein [Puniceicoccales bacterium]|jgi:microcin C transport system substrate-binding protein|nr:extracellular solute-binding protein [Puniceicoccales bacterium]
MNTAATARPPIAPVITSILILLTFLFAAPTTTAESIPVPPQAAAYYKSRPDFFHFATPADLPKNLQWQTNLSDPEFASPDAKRGGTITFSIATYPPTLRRVGPNANHSFRGYSYDNYYIALTMPHPNTDNPIPGTATHWAISPDRRTVYYKLNPDVRFNDGQPVTADDYLFTFYFYTSPHLQAPWYKDFYTNEFAGITKYDDYTIAITLPDERPDPVYNTSIEPTPRNFFKDLDATYPISHQLRQQPTTGPYRINPDKLVPEQSITLDRIPNWWADKLRYYRHRHNPDHVIFRVVRDPSKSYQMFLIGDLDLMEIRIPKFWYALNNEAPLKNGFIEKHTFYYDRPCPTWGLFLNTFKPGLDNHHVRLGIQHATDWQRVISTFFRGDYQRLNNFAEGFGKFTNPAVRARPYNPTTAMRHFAAAGYTQRDPDGILRNPLTNTRLSFQLTSRDTDVRKCLPTLIDSARKAGLEFRPEALETTTFFKKTQEKKHDIAFTAWNVSNKYPTFWESFHIENAITTKSDGTIIPKRQTNNITSTRDKTLSTLIDKYRAAKTEDELLRLGYEIQQRIHDDACFVPAYKVVTSRVALWRWIRTTPEFGMKSSDDIFETGTFWIDETIKKETRTLQTTTTTLPPIIRIHDQYNTER